MSTTAVSMPPLDTCGISLGEQTVSFLAATRLPKISVFFPDFQVDDTMFRLNRPLEVVLESAGKDEWVCQEKIFSLSGFGKTSVEAIYSVFEDIAVLWDEIAQAPDEELSENAQRTKRELLGFVKSVTKMRP
jgi:hypothetical protein